MRRWALSVLVVVPTLLAVMTPVAHAKGKVPVRLAQARYVALGYDTPKGFVSEQEALTSAYVLPEERYLLEAIREQIEKWGQYVVVERRKDAELLIGVRLARLATVGGGGIIGSGNAGRTSGSIVGGEISSPYDLFTVYESSGAILWRAQRKGALSGVPPVAFGEFRADFERVAKK